ncbi:MAG: radical SAM protein [Myxococcales bacterium]|nr:radical SAM protein [Myxococcales bacterium]
MSVSDGTAVPRLDFELSAACDHRCAHCYNVWGAEPGDAQQYSVQDQLRTGALKRLMTKGITQSGCTHVTITGGEPLLAVGALDLIAHAASLVPSVTLITNGSHVTDAVARRLAEIGVGWVQLTLLSADRELHDRLKGAVCFDDTVRAAVALRQAGVGVQVCYVAMRENAGHLESVMELCHVLGVQQLSYNRMSPTGGAIHHIERLMPSVEDIEADLAVADRLGRAWNIAVGTAMPIPPCLVRYERTPWVRFGSCSTGSSSPNLVVDVMGNVRSCNLSTGVLGNLARDDWDTIMASSYPATFVRSVPEMCRGCAFERSCQGGCKESGFATFGDHAHPEPLLWAALRHGET